MAVAGGVGRAALGRKLEGPLRVFGPENSAAFTVDTYVSARGAKEVIFLLVSDATAATFTGFNPRFFVENSLMATANEGGLLYITQTGSIGSEGTIVYVRPIATTTSSPSGSRIMVNSVGLQGTGSASLPNLRIDAYIVWD